MGIPSLYARAWALRLNASDMSKRGSLGGRRLPRLGLGCCDVGYTMASLPMMDSEAARSSSLTLTATVAWP